MGIRSRHVIGDCSASGSHGRAAGDVNLTLPESREATAFPQAMPLLCRSCTVLRSPPLSGCPSAKLGLIAAPPKAANGI